MARKKTSKKEKKSKSVAKTSTIPVVSTTPTPAAIKSTTPKKTSYYGYYGGYSNYDDYDDYDDSGWSGYSGYSGYGSGYSGYGSYYGSSYRGSYYGSYYGSGGSGSGYSYGGSFYSRYSSTFGSSSSKLSASTAGKTFANDAELLSKAFKETRDFVVILDFPFEVKITFSNYDGVQLKEDERFIFLETGVLSNNSKSSDEKINIICGLGIHEACHLKFTTYQVTKEFYDRLDTLSSSLEIDDIRVSYSKFVKSIFNLLEDLRVENQLLLERPGYSDLLLDAKNYKFSQYKESLPMGINKDTKNYIDTVIRLIRFPDEVDKEVLKSDEEKYTKIKEILSTPLINTKDSCSIAVKIFNETIKYVKDFNGFVDNSDSTKGQIDRMLNAFGTALNDVSSTVFYGIDATSDKGTVISENSRKGNIANAVQSDTAAGMVTGSVIKGEKDDTFFIKLTGDAESYLHELQEVRPLIPAMNKIVFGCDKNYDFNIYGCRSGLLDTTKLAEAYQGVPQVYIQKGEVRTNKLSVVVLIDESGSMGWGLDDLARKAAILINESLGKAPGIDLYVYGHSADQNYDGSTEIYIYREGKTYCPKYSLSRSWARRENRDGTAIREVATRVRSLTSDKCVMIVLSDGAPCATNYGGHSAYYDVKTAVQEAEKKDISVIQVTLGAIRDVSYMFPVNIDLQHSLSELPLELAKVVKKKIVDNKKTTIK